MMVGLFAGLCTSEGHNKSRTGNKYQTSDGKMTAVAFAHQAVRNAKLDYHNPEFELIDQGYKRTNSQVDRKQSVTTPMLLKMREILGPMDPPGRLLWRSIILSFFFLDRCSKLWGPVPIDRSTGKDRVHCFKAHRETNKGSKSSQKPQTATLWKFAARKTFFWHWPARSEVVSVAVAQPSHLAVQSARPGKVTAAYLWCALAQTMMMVIGAVGPEIAFKVQSHTASICARATVPGLAMKTDDPLLYPVLAAQDCLRVRKETIKKAQVANLIKNAAKNMGLSQKDYSCHWLRTGGVCALLAAGKSDLVIRLMGRWSSWCFSVYATWNDTRRGK
ncbi:hypothetical protein PC117_g21782 [Phytophthora cactorum]|uniref:Tyr recombinase domain-containing protein n=1 Tax=Phytophthora cactorum TaxID=29920 RepID=A0A8T1BEC9_9STRA|nr:hypothetical protein PC117_g21782 [Phytophthora cactorum]